MGVVNYITVNGAIIGEETVGGARIDYAVDALGSVTGTLVSGAMQNVYAYKPYGALLQKAGAGADPSFGWVGTHGYKPTKMVQADIYVRERTLSTANARWLTVDPSWPDERPYAYVNGRPTSSADPSGLGQVVQGHCDTPDLVYGHYYGYIETTTTPDDIGWTHNWIKEEDSLDVTSEGISTGTKWTIEVSVGIDVGFFHIDLTRTETFPRRQCPKYHMNGAGTFWSCDWEMQHAGTFGSKWGLLRMWHCSGAAEKDAVFCETPFHHTKPKDLVVYNMSFLHGNSHACSLRYGSRPVQESWMK